MRNADIIGKIANALPLSGISSALRDNALNGNGAVQSTGIVLLYRLFSGVYDELKEIVTSVLSTNF
jgi:hypothetical protein